MPKKVAALAGRRVDGLSIDAPQFPLAAVASVRRRLKELLVSEAIDILICSAACGADLLALEAATEAGIRFRIVLPFEVEAFKRTSVVDRPGDWGPLFDRVVLTARERNELRVLGFKEDDRSSYSRATQYIVQESVAEAGARTAIAIVVWEGHPREGADETESFRRLALAEGLSIRTILTLAQ